MDRVRKNKALHLIGEQVAFKRRQAAELAGMGGTEAEKIMNQQRAGRVIEDYLALKEAMEVILKS